MNIGMVLGKDFPPDIRVEKESRALIRAGFNVFLLCRRKENKKLLEDINGLIIKRIDLRKSTPCFYLNLLYFYLTFYHPVWAREIEKFILEKNIDALHVHDLPFVGTALKIGEARNIPVVADLHEMYPAALAASETPLWRRFYFENPKRWEKLEKKCLKEVDKIIVVVDEAKGKILKNYNINLNKITVVSNTADVNFFTSLPLDEELIKKYREKYRNNFFVSYIGGFESHRGLDVAVKAMTLITKKNLDVKLLLVGGKANEAGLRNLAKKINLEEKIIFTGWQPAEKLPTFISLSNICLVPHHKTPHTDSTIPHKLFQYMLMKKPVIVSNCKPLERIVNETKAGLVFQAGNFQDLAEKIIQIYKNPDQYGENGYQAVLEKYNWEREAEKLIELYNKMGERSERRS